jgi:prepilin-type N-terminal cleavage/methylation domain-containing protein
MKKKMCGPPGFTLVEIMIVVAIIGLLSAVAVPNFVHARKQSQSDACINNLRQIDGAKQEWALETGKGSTDLPTAAQIQPYIGRGDNGGLDNVHCPLILPGGPLGGYTVNVVGTAPSCNQYDAALHPAVVY